MLRDVSIGMMTACSNDDIDKIVPEADATICFGVATSISLSLIDDATQMGRFKVWVWCKPENAIHATQMFDAQVMNYDAGSAGL